jgi:hypothetical protein
MKLNRGFVIVTAILAGLIIGLYAGAYIYITLVPTDTIINNAAPKQLRSDPVGLSPQYRDFYVVRAATRYQHDQQIGYPDPLKGAYDVLGVTTGDTSIDEAIEMVRTAEKVAIKENSVDGEAGQFTKNDELALGTLAAALEQAKATNTFPKPDTMKYAPLIARNTTRIVGAIILLILGAFAFLVIYVVDKLVNARSTQTIPVTPRPPGLQQPLNEVPVVPMQTQKMAAPASRPTSPGTPGGGAQSIPMTSVAAVETALLTPPPTMYRHGDDHYDEDFAINGPMGELIGECGATIADRIGLETPARVSALSLWVFDKNDFQSTTKVLMTEYAWNDQAVRNKLSVKGDAVQAQEGGVVEIMTSTLRVEVQVTQLNFNGDQSLPNSYFQNVTLTFNVYRRSPAA